VTVNRYLVMTYVMRPARFPTICTIIWASPVQPANKQPIIAGGRSGRKGRYA